MRTIEIIKEDISMWCWMAISVLISGFAFQLGKKLCNKVLGE